MILYHENLEPGLNGFWVEAKDLQVGDVFLGATGELSTLVQTCRTEIVDGITVYNFEVADNHNYFILARDDEYGQTCILVHNAWYHGTDANSADDILKNGLNQNKLRDSHNLVEKNPLGLYVTDDLAMAKDYARLRAEGGSGKILEFDDIEDLLIGAGTKNNEAIIPFSAFPNVTKIKEVQ